VDVSEAATDVSRSISGATTTSEGSAIVNGTAAVVVSSGTAISGSASAADSAGNSGAGVSTLMAGAGSSCGAVMSSEDECADGASSTTGSAAATTGASASGCSASASETSDISASCGESGAALAGLAGDDGGMGDNGSSPSATSDRTVMLCESAGAASCSAGAGVAGFDDGGRTGVDGREAVGPSAGVFDLDTFTTGAESSSGDLGSAVVSGSPGCDAGVAAPGVVEFDASPTVNEARSRSSRRSPREAPAAGIVLVSRGGVSGLVPMGGDATSDFLRLVSALSANVDGVLSKSIDRREFGSGEAGLSVAPAASASTVLRNDENIGG